MDVNRNGRFLFLRKILGNTWFRVVVSLAIIAVLLTKLPLKELREAVGQISIGLWAFAVLVFLFGHVIGVVKWRLLVNLKRPVLPFTVSFRCYFAGLFANLCLPSLVGGDVIRAGIAIRRCADKESVISGSVIDRFLDISSLIVIIFAGALMSPGALSAGDRNFLFCFLILSAAVVILILSFIFLPFPGFKSERINGKIGSVRDTIVYLTKNPQRAVAAFSLSLIIQSGFVFCNIVLGRACGIDIHVPVWFMAWPLAKLSALMPVSLGGLGVREAALAVTLERFGVQYAKSVGLGLLWETVLVAGGIAGGFIYLALSKKAFAKKDFIDAKNSGPIVE